MCDVNPRIGLANNNACPTCAELLPYALCAQHLQIPRMISRQFRFCGPSVEWPRQGAQARAGQNPAYVATAGKPQASKQPPIYFYSIDQVIWRVVDVKPSQHAA